MRSLFYAFKTYWIAWIINAGCLITFIITDFPLKTNRILLLMLLESLFIGSIIFRGILDKRIRLPIEHINGKTIIHGLFKNVELDTAEIKKVMVKEKFILKILGFSMVVVSTQKSTFNILTRRFLFSKPISN